MATKQELSFDSDDINSYIINDVGVVDLPMSLSELESGVTDLGEININPGSFPGLSLSTPLLQEDPDVTLDIADKEILYGATQIIQQPVIRYGPPEKGAFKGDYDFQVQVMAADTHKRKYLYSHKLNRIYVDMGSNFTVHFSWEFMRAPRPMYVRATTVFSLDDQAQKRVERCIQHRHRTANNGIHPMIVNHVLRSTRELETTGVSYCGDETRKDSWYSVLVEFGRQPDAGSLSHSHAYQFVCKNSCSTGINRRAIDILFTLEDDTGTICGRQSVGARVCACPRRDILKDEETEAATSGGVKRKLSTKTKQVTCKKVKLELARQDGGGDDDDKVYTLPAGLQVIGSNTLSTGLTVMINMMKQIARYKTSHELDNVQKAIASIKSVRDQYCNNN